MRYDSAYANVELSYEGKSVKLRALANAEASRSISNMKLANKLRAFMPR